MMQAKDVPEAPIVAMLRPFEDYVPVSRYEIRDTLPDVPEKVLLAKLRSMVKRKVIDGCACGCRGDFTLPTQERR
jgi:hypothetical protein